MQHWIKSVVTRDVGNELERSSPVRARNSLLAWEEKHPKLTSQAFSKIKSYP